MKFKYRFTAYSLLSPIVFFFLIMVHEFSHVIAIILTGNEWTEFVVAFPEYVGIKTKYNNIDAYPIIAIAGSIGDIIICSIIICVSIKFKNLYFSFFGFSQVVVEFIYWGVSPIIEFGDAYNMYKFLKFENWQLLSVFFLVIALSLFVFYVIYHYKIFSEKHNIYLKRKSEIK